MSLLQKVPDIDISILSADVEYSRPCQGPVPCRVPFRCAARLKERSALNTSLKGTLKAFLFSLSVTLEKLTMIFIFKHSLVGRG